MSSYDAAADMLPEWTVIGFTGHRHLQKPELVAGAIGATLDRLDARTGPLAAVASAAAGADLLFAEEVVRRKIPLVLILPFPKQRFRADLNAVDWARVEVVMGAAAHVQETSSAVDDEGAYLETGLSVVDECDVLLAVSDPDHVGGVGGTNQIVDYARETNKPIVTVDPTTGGTSDSRLDHLPAKRAAIGAGDTKQLITDYLQEVSGAAERLAPRARHLLLRIILLHLFGAAVALSALALEPVLQPRGLANAADIGATAVELFCVGWATFLALRHHRARGGWLRDRVAAELCRSFLASWQPLAPGSLRRQVLIPGFDRLYKSLRISRYLDHQPSPSADAIQHEYLDTRVKDQIKYFSGARDHAKAAYRVLKGLAVSASVGAMAAAAVGFVLHHVLHGPITARAICELLALVLPLVNAALVSLIVSQDYARRVARYADVVKLLQASSAKLARPRTLPKLTELIGEIEQILLQEVVEWYAFARFAGEPH